MSKEFINSQYYLVSVLIMLVSIAVFYFKFEKRKPQAKEIVTLAVLSAIAVASRAAFVMFPSFKPMSGIIMISGMAFGPSAGFLVGTVSAFVSNFIFGQGPWTPWQMFAYGIAGMLAGILYKRKIMHEDKQLQTSILGGVIVIALIGPILDTCSIFTGMTVINKASIAAIYLSGLPLNIIHGVATILTLFIVCKPMMEKLNRIKVKYGMMDGEENEI